MLSSSFSIRIVFFVALITAIILHEISHGIVALWCGDPTAKEKGRLTLNPLKHIDPVGTVVIPLLGVLTGLPVIGWAKPVPVNPNRMHKPREQMLLVGLAGPATNFVLMAISAVIARQLVSGQIFTLGEQSSFLITWFSAFAFVNLILGVFNLLPFPPLDGSSLIERFLPRNWLPYWYRYRMYGILVLFLVVFTTNILSTILSPFADALNHFISST